MWDLIQIICKKIYKSGYYSKPTFIIASNLMYQALMYLSTKNEAYAYN